MKATKLRKQLKHLALALPLGVGMMALSAYGQETIEVGGVGVIADTVLDPGSALSIVGANWTVEGNEAGPSFIETHLISPDIVVPTTGTVTLTFDHRYFIEGNWDGGGIFVSIDGAAATYVPGTSLTGQGYDGTATLGTAWPGGEEVFTGTSPGYATPVFVQTVADLGVLTAGQTVSVEFRHGSDGGYSEPGTDWEINTVKLTDGVATDFLDLDFPVDGASGFTLGTAGGGNLQEPWVYRQPTHRFEINADSLTADTYSPNGAETVIDLNGANIVVSLLAGVLDVGDTFTLFDTTGSVTLTGSVGSLSLPGGTWDTSLLETTGVITCLIPPELALIYEPFDDLDLTLSGNAPGKGLSGTWNPGENHIADGSLTYGKIAYSGGRAVVNPGDEFNTNGISHGTTLTDANLLDDGATLWFSVIIVKTADTAASTNDRRTYFTLGTGQPDGFDRIGGNSGSGFGVAVNKTNNAIQTRGWNNGSDGGGGAGGFTGGTADTSVPEGATFLAVGKITWGVFGTADSDVLELYLPDLDLNLGSPVSTLSADFDQNGLGIGGAAANAFDTIGFAGGRRANLVPELDEIRFAGNLADVLPLDFIDPLLVTTDNASGDPSQRLATFDEFVYAGTGDIRIVNDTDVSMTTITLPDSQVVFFENTLTFTPTVPLLGGKSYHIEIDAGAVTDRNLNAFAGISDSVTWAFNTDGTPPTVASFGDNTSPNPILTNSSGRLTYTVTFDEPIDAGTVDVTDFAATAGSAPITIDSVTATGPAVFEVAVSTLGTTGTLALEIVALAVISDVNGNDLDTTTALPSDNTINVTNPTANAGSIANDFQGTISSQANALNGGGNGRYFHVSVNPDNAGTGWYSANDVAGAAAPAGFRKYGGDVVAYKFLGGTSNSISGIAASGGDDGRISYTTTDPAFDGFDQQQMRIWTTNDPGADISSGAGVGATGFANPNYGYRGISQVDGFVDISGLASGSVHIYYGSYNSAPTVKVTLHDSDNVGADIVIANIHSVADGGNGDSANTGENYVAEIDFVTDGVYDVLEYEFTSGNGNGHGAVLTGPEPLSDYDTWAEQFAPADLTDPGADLDGDGLTNNEERLFGLDPTDPASQTPITIGLDAGAGTFSFTQRDDALTGLFTDIETSTDLLMWTVDNGAALVITGPDANGVESVDVTLSAGLLTAPKLFVRVNLNDGTLLSENFESGNGGFTSVFTAGSDWADGAPDSNSLGGFVDEGNGGSANCFGTNLGAYAGGTGDEGFYDVPTTDSCLRSPLIDLTGVTAANLTFAEALDLDGSDTAVVNILDATDTVIGAAVYTADDSANQGDANWNNVGPIDLTPYVGQSIKIEWCLTGGGTDFLGWYVDDVTVTKTAP